MTNCRFHWLISRYGRWVWLVGMLCLNGHSWAQTLPEAIRQALLAYPAAEAARANSAGAAAELDRARAARWPVLSIGATGVEQTGAPRPWSGSPQLSYSVFAGGGIEAGVDRAQSLLGAAEWRAGATYDDVAQQAAEAYLGWSRAQDLVELARDNVIAHQRIHDDVAKIVAVDTGRRIDLFQAQVRVDAARLTQVQREIELAQANERLARFLGGMLPPKPAGIDAEPGRAPSGLSDALVAASNEHPQLAQLAAQLEGARAGVNIAKAQRMPKIDFSVSRPVNPYTQQVDTLAQLSVSMPVFNGGALVAGVDVARAQERAAELALDESRLVVRERISASWAEWQSSASRARLSEEQRRSGATLVNGYQEQFRLARRSLLDLLNIQNDFFNYGSAAISAGYERRVARFRLSAAMGELGRFYLAGNQRAEK
jgi:outer membrane protein, adhesin transport system